jgi:hypothetical protein
VTRKHKESILVFDSVVNMFVVQTTCALGVVRDFKELAKYNLRMLTNPELEKKPPSSKDTSSKPEANPLERPVQEDAPPATTSDAADATLAVESEDKLEDSKTADLDKTTVDAKAEP